MTEKTTSGVRIGISWTPNTETASAFMADLFGADCKTIITSGRMQLRHSIALDTSSTDQVVKATQMMDELKAELSKHGTVHKFSHQYGRVLPSESVELKA
ncbi:hypothetical protein [Marivivens aquimaris]|uniref:hypothetical protein n=1 Tax=Marivivens aquimaris TaxID=2774876 RepID=UPI00187FDDB2|nr:hypothetical protein [Marivivens aquimaris]